MLGLFRRKPHERAGYALYTEAVRAAREPYFYTALGVPDTLDGRFDLVGLHVFLIIDRLRAAAEPGPGLAQATFDAMFADMDFNLREMGVGDMSVAKRNKEMWEAFHGRSMAYAAALAGEGPMTLEEALDRNVWRGGGASRGGGGAGGACAGAEGGPGRHGRRGVRRRRVPVSCPACGCGMTLELSRPLCVDRLPASFLVDASVEERAALAARLQIPEVRSLWCRFTLRRRGEAVLAEGEMRAAVVQSCVVSLDPVEQAVAETFRVRFVPAGTEKDDEDPESPDELPYEGDTIDLGEAAAEQLALALDPYPRHPDAVLDPAAQDEPSPGFAGLAALRLRQ